MAEAVRVLRLDVLDGLTVAVEQVDPHDATLELGVRRLNDLVVLVVLVLKRVETLQNLSTRDPGKTR